MRLGLNIIDPSLPTQTKPMLATVIEMTDSFCKEYLNEEYAEICRQLATTLHKRHPSFFVREKLQRLACGIVRTIGWVNFLYDPNQEPHLELAIIDKTFGTSRCEAQSEFKTIQETLNIRHFEPKWTLPSQMGDNPRTPRLPF